MRHQNAVLLALLAVEAFHQPLLFAGKLPGCFVACGVEVFAVHHAHRHRVRGAPEAQGFIEPPLIGRLVFDRRGLVMGDQGVEVGSQALAVAHVVDGHVAHPVARAFEPGCEIAHGCKNAQHLLRMVAHVIGLAAHFHQHVDHIVIHLAEPAVQRVQLIAQDQTQGRTGRRAHDEAPLRGLH